MRKIIIGVGITFVLGLVAVFLVFNSGNPANTVQKPVPQETQQKNNMNDVGLTQEEMEQRLDLQKKWCKWNLCCQSVIGQF